MTPESGNTPTLGEFLRQERERRGITIEQVASATKISVRLLHLLESDQYAELPAKPFIRGFVNSYCRFIGVDSKEALIRYGDFLEEHSHERPTRDEGHSGYAFEKREGEQSRTVLGIVMAAFVVIAALAFVVLKPSLKHRHNSHVDKLRAANESPSPEPSPTASPSASESLLLAPVPTEVPSMLIFTPSPTLSPSASPSPTPSPSPSKSMSPEVVAKPSPSPSPSASPEKSGEKSDTLNSGVNLTVAEIKYKIVLKTVADVWVRYQVDERPKMKFILRSGRVLVLRAEKRIVFQSSQPDAITFRVNGSADRAMEGDSNAALRGNDLTLFFPRELVETIKEPFPGDHALQGVAVPLSRAPGPRPSSTP